MEADLLFVDFGELNTNILMHEDNDILIVQYSMNSLSFE